MTAPESRRWRAQRRLAPALLALTLVACVRETVEQPSVPAAPTPAAPGPAAPAAPVAGLFGVSGSEYWTDPWKNLKDVAWNAMAEKRVILAIDAPAVVPLAERKTIPLLAFQSGPTEELARTPFRTLAVIALVDLAENRLLAARLPRPKGPPEGGAAPSPGFASVEEQVELTELFRIPWEPSRFVVTALVRDAATNRVQVTLEGAATAQGPARSPAVAAPDSPYVRHGRREGGLEPPAATGLAMRAAKEATDAPASIEIAYRLATSASGGTLSLLVYGSESNVPRVFPVALPSDVGACVVDLHALAGLGAEPQTWFVAAFSGESMAGPIALGVAR